MRWACGRPHEQERVSPGTRRSFVACVRRTSLLRQAYSADSLRLSLTHRAAIAWLWQAVWGSTLGSSPFRSMPVPSGNGPPHDCPRGRVFSGVFGRGPAI